MDPDLIRDKNYLAQAADVWALGVLLFFMLTGKMPFYSTDANELAEMICKGKYKLEIYGGRFSQPCQALVAKLLDKNASRRITAA